MPHGQEAIQLQGTNRWRLINALVAITAVQSLRPAKRKEIWIRARTNITEGNKLSFVS